MRGDPENTYCFHTLTVRTGFMMPSATTPAALSTLRVSKHLVPSHGLLPNSSILHKPLLIYHSVFANPSPQQ